MPEKKTGRTEKGRQPRQESREEREKAIERKAERAKRAMQPPIRNCSREKGTGQEGEEEGQRKQTYKKAMQPPVIERQQAGQKGKEEGQSREENREGREGKTWMARVDMDGPGRTWLDMNRHA